FGRQRTLVIADKVVEQNHRPRVRQHGFDGVRAGLHVRVTSFRPSTSATLLPPKANELLSIASPPAIPANPFPGATNANGGIAGSAPPSQTCGGSRRSRFQARLSASQRKAASHAPAAPRVWPATALVELQAVERPNRACTALPSIRSFCWVPVPWRLM